MYSLRQNIATFGIQFLSQNIATSPTTTHLNQSQPSLFNSTYFLNLRRKTTFSNIVDIFWDGRSIYLYRFNWTGMW